LKTGKWKDKYAEASTPELATVELTDILLDAWSMTSIIEPMPGRPQVGPWLRGIAEWEPPQTEVAWRAELDVEGFADLKPDDIEDWFDAHRILTHEVLTEKTSNVAEWFKDRWNQLSDAERRELNGRPVIIDRAGLEVRPLGEVLKRLERKDDSFMRYSQIVVPASFGGIRRGVGLLEADEPKPNKDDEGKSGEEQKPGLKDLHQLVDVADVNDDAIVRQRCREKIKMSEDGETITSKLDSKAVLPKPHARFSIQLVSDDDRTIRLVSYGRRREKPEIGAEPQTLRDHVGAVRKFADQIIQALRLAVDDPIRLALELAADWHDHGKVRERWQRLLVFPKGYIKPNEPMGKSGCEMKRDASGYRHEFGSLREFTDAFNAGFFVDRPISRGVFDLAAHMIAAHHGRGRPHFPKGGFDPDCEIRSVEIHVESIRRFARLQQKYGWWKLAWLENLLRCADAMASAEQDTADEPTIAEGSAE
jgi:CRISPR-associated endonuclease/helicase Cas3